MQSRQQRIRRRRDSAREWIRSGARVTVHGYAKRFGVDRYTAYDDLTSLGLTLPASARRWAQRPPSNPQRAASGDDRPIEDPWIMLDGRQFFVAGFTSGGMPYGIFEDEIDQMESGDLDEDEPLYDSVEDKSTTRGALATSAPSTTIAHSELSELLGQRLDRSSRHGWRAPIG